MKIPSQKQAIDRFQRNVIINSCNSIGKPAIQFGAHFALINFVLETFCTKNFMRRYLTLRKDHKMVHSLQTGL